MTLFLLLLLWTVAAFAVAPTIGRFLGGSTPCRPSGAFGRQPADDSPPRAWAPRRSMPSPGVPVAPRPVVGQKRA